MRALMGLIKDRHGTYHAQRKVPERLQEAVARVLKSEKPKQVFLKKSLGTKVLREANVAATHVLADFNRTLASAEALLKERPVVATLTDAMIKRMAEWVHATSAGAEGHSEGVGAAQGSGLWGRRAALENLEESEMTEYVIRFLVGGAVVSAFAMLGDLLRPKSFAGLFGAAPSVALATLGIAVYQHGAGYAALQAQAMIAGAIALAIYSVVVCQLLVRAKLRAVMATLLSLVVWLVAAFGLLMFAGGQT